MTLVSRGGDHLRILLAKPGMDGHSRGVQVVRQALRDAGFHVIYLGIRQSTNQIARSAVDEDVALVGLSILSGTHIEYTRELRSALDSMEAHDIRIIVGGVIPTEDVQALIDEGAAAVFRPGTTTDEIIDKVRAIASHERGDEGHI